MKIHHAILLGIAIGLVLGGLITIYTRTPCQPMPVAPDTEAMVQRSAERDSLDRAILARRTELDSLNAITPSQRNERSTRIARSLSRGAQLDTLLAEPS
jgi:hypothetical protein